MNDPNVEGLARSLQGSIMVLVGVLVVIAICVAIVLHLIKKAEEDHLDSDEAATGRRWTWGAGVSVALLSVGIFVWYAVAVASTNRMPRSDIDKSPVYEQMDSHGKSDNTNNDRQE